MLYLKRTLYILQAEFCFSCSKIISKQRQGTTKMNINSTKNLVDKDKDCIKYEWALT